MLRRLAAFLAAVSLLSVSSAASPAAATFVVADPSTWSNATLAAQLVVAGVPMDNLTLAESWVRSGLGGIVLLGKPPGDLAPRLASVRAAGAVPPFVASDEEGGDVQRLAPVIYRLPSAESMGVSWPVERVRAAAADYGLRMRALGVDMALSPVADLGIPGYYIEQRDRAFSADPARVSAYVAAWTTGMRAAHVAPVVKHWPGHGQAADTHTGAATTPPLSTLERRDLVPFGAAVRAGVPSVMVGHLFVPGLTERDTPASVSPNAMRYLRSRVGPSTLIVTDSLSMGAVTSTLRISAADAALRALRAGADMAMLNVDPMPAVDRIRRALDSGAYSRSAAVASARRVLAVKRFTDAAPVPLSGPAAAPGGSGALLVAHRMLDGAVALRRVAGTRWEPATLLGGATRSAPAVISAGLRTYVFIRGTDNYVHYRVRTGSSWSPWVRLDTGGLIDAPAAVGTPDGGIELAVRTSGNRLLVRSLTLEIGWSPAVDVGTTTAPPGIAVTPAGEVVVVGRNGAGAVVARSKLSRAAEPWQPWVSLGGSAVGAVAVAAEAETGGVVVAIRGTDGRLRAIQRSGAAWSAWSVLGGSASEGPALANATAGSVVLVYRGGATNDLYLRGWTRGSWGAVTHRWY